MSSKSKKGGKPSQRNSEEFSVPSSEEKTDLATAGIAMNENEKENRETVSLPATLNEKPKVLRTQRVDEKNMLIGFNNRLAAIIEKNHQLEHTNKTLRTEVHKAEEDLSLTVTRLEMTYEKELDDSRNLLKQGNQENAKLKLNETQARQELTELQKKLAKKDKDAAELKKNLSYADVQIVKLTSEVQQASTKNASLEKDNKDLEEEKFRLAQELSELRCKYEEECLAKVDLQDQLKGKIEENNVKTHLFEQQLVQVKSSRALEIQEVDGRLQKEYELKLQEALKELRADYEMEIERNKDEQKNLYNRKETDLVSQINILSESISNKVQELEVLQAKLEDACDKNTNLEGQKYALTINIQELEKKIKQDREKFNVEKKKAETENEKLRKDKTDLISEYLDLLETKTALDNELATYRVLLEGEEQRLNLLPEPEPTKTDANENIVVQ